jgi:hypothetical protein
MQPRVNGRSRSNTYSKVVTWVRRQSSVSFLDGFLLAVMMFRRAAEFHHQRIPQEGLRLSFVSK